MLHGIYGHMVNKVVRQNRGYTTRLDIVWLQGCSTTSTQPNIIPVTIWPQPCVVFMCRLYAASNLKLIKGFCKLFLGRFICKHGPSHFPLTCVMEDKDALDPKKTFRKASILCAC
jgi:hypothetical protein